MVRLIICAVIFVLSISSSSSITIRRETEKFTKIPDVSSQHSFYFVANTKKNSYLDNNVAKNTSSYETKKQQNSDFEKDILKRHTITPLIHPVHGHFIESFQTPRQYLSTISSAIPDVKNDLKPIHKTSQKPIYEETTDYNTNGYFYKKPISQNIELFKDYHDKPEYSYSDLTAVILELNRLVQAIEKTKSYNSVLHIPTNPTLALILSHYGKYTMETPKYHSYSYAASNNVHNNKPFGQYKYAIEEV